MFAAARTLQLSLGLVFPFISWLGSSFTIKAVDSDLLGSELQFLPVIHLTLGPEWMFPLSQASGWNFSVFDFSDRSDT